ncbi:MAG: hypothetical protein OCD76_20050 [Reichenbachiella sp.]
MSLVTQINTPEVKDFIQAHLNDDPIQLILKGTSFPRIPIKEVAHQIQCIKKAKTKLPYWASIEAIIYPPGISLEQSSSEATATYKASLFKGKTVTDLTGGFGIDSYHLSKQMERVDYVEQNSTLHPIVQHNFAQLGADNICFHPTDALSYLNEENVPSDSYFIDPARRDDTDNRVFKIEDCRPNLNEVLPQLMKRKAEVVIKLSPLLDIQQSLSQIANVSELHIVSVNNECKELLFKLNFSVNNPTTLHAINIQKSGTDVFEFDYSQEDQLPEFSDPKTYIYEPNASVMKSGGFNSVANQFDLAKLHRNSHLYTSDQKVEDFPGRTFILEAVSVMNKKKLKSFLPNNKANITVRNYPETVQQIRKKMGIKDGGNVYLFATTLMDGSPKVLVCRK